MIYFTSDLHFCHCKPFLYEPRGFKNVYEMNQAIIKNWNSVVSVTDDVYVLGDLMLLNNVEGASYIKQLKGQIHIILGNHDSEARQVLYSNFYNVVEICWSKMLKYDGYHFYLSHYPALTSNWDQDKPLKARVVSLCGHSHTKDPFMNWDLGPIYHVELDAHNNTPISIEDIIKDIERKSV